MLESLNQNSPAYIHSGWNSNTLTLCSIYIFLPFVPLGLGRICETLQENSENSLDSLNSDNNLFIGSVTTNHSLLKQSTWFVVCKSTSQPSFREILLIISNLDFCNTECPLNHTDFHKNSYYSPIVLLITLVHLYFVQNAKGKLTIRRKRIVEGDHS